MFYARSVDRTFWDEGMIDISTVVISLKRYFYKINF